jgi:gamma-glutamyl:cysteine ligase YbdK (ATP-grasp superfamily)
MDKHFGSGRPYTVGAEEEFQLVDPSTRELTPAIGDVLATARADGSGRMEEELGSLARLQIIYGLHVHVAVPHAEAAIRATKALLRPVAQSLGCEAELGGILEIVRRGTGAELQRAVYERRGSLEDVVDYLVETTVPAGEP